MNLHKALSIHFTLSEFLHEGSLEGVTPDVLASLALLSRALEGIRLQLGNRPIHINSGFRTPEHNRAVGGAPESQHLLGNAADIVVDGLTPAQVQAALKDWSGGLGSYSTWTHVDIGPKRRWNGA